MHKLQTQIIILFIILAFPLSAQQKKENENIFKIANMLSGEKKLKYISSQINSEGYSTELINLYVHESTKQKNDYFLALAYNEKVFQMRKEGKSDSLKIYLDLLIDKVHSAKQNMELTSNQQKKLDQLRRASISVKAKLYTFEQKFNLALIEIDKLLDDSNSDKNRSTEAAAYTLLGTTYLYSRNFEEAINNFRKSTKIYQKKRKRIGDYEFYQPLEGIATAYILTKRFTEAKQTIDSLANMVEKECNDFQKTGITTPKDDFKYHFFSQRAAIYEAYVNINLNELRTARRQLDHIKDFIEAEYGLESLHPDFRLYFLVEAEYYLAINRNEKAKLYITQLTDNITIGENPMTYLLSNLTLAKVLNASGQSKDAYSLMYKLFQKNDSIASTNFSIQAAEMQTMYQLEKAEMHVEQHKVTIRMTRLILTIAIIAFLLALLIIYQIWQNRRKVIEKNIQLHNQYREIEIRNRTISELLTTQNNSKEEENTDTADQYSTLIENLDDYLEKSQVYLQADITREALALAIGTNRQYLIEAIREKKGKTFNEYIYSYRLKYAYEKIMHDKNKKITDILVESGFNTRATFYKAFKDTYGMSPHELRDIANMDK